MNTILFDIDGTLLDLNKDEFIESLFEDIASYLSDIHHPNIVKKILLEGMIAMAKHETDDANYVVFKKTIDKYVENTDRFISRLDEYYLNVFEKLGCLVKSKKSMQESISILKSKGYKLVIATNPMYPASAVIHRINWTGIDTRMFSYFSDYKSHRYTKSNSKFYLEIANKLKLEVTSCMMVGNDLKYDMAAQEVGMKTFFLTDNGVNNNVKRQVTHKGNSEAFLEYVRNLPFATVD